jgi:hypothetical protein
MIPFFCGCILARVFSSVDLPIPLVPTILINSPLLIEKLMFSETINVSFLFEYPIDTFFTSIILFE